MVCGKRSRDYDLALCLMCDAIRTYTSSSHAVVLSLAWGLSVTNHSDGSE